MSTRFDAIYERLLLLSWFFSLLEIALHMPMVSFLTPYKIFLALLGLLILLRVFLQGMPFVRDFLHSLKVSLVPVRWAMLPVGLYLVFDLISFLWTGDIRFALSKYVTIISMLAILVATAYYMQRIYPELPKRTKMQRLLFTIGMTGIATALYTLVYLLFNGGMTYYTRRFSMIEDYNQFSAVPLFSYLAMLLYLHRTEKKDLHRLLLLLGSTVLCVSSVWLSGSRRTFYLMLACLVVAFALEFILMLVKKEPRRVILRSLVTLGLAAVITLGLNQLYTTGTTKQYNEMVEDNQDILQVIGARTVEEILTDTHALSKRETIWSIAIDGYLDLPLTGKLFGGGASYHADIYDTPENKPVIERMYWRDLPDHYMNPHNFVLVDLLSGGIVKTTLMLLSLLGTLLSLLMITKKRPAELVYFLLLAFFALGNIFISSKFGYLNDKFVWSVLILLMALAAEERVRRLH